MQILLLGLILFSFILHASGLVHHLKISNDERRLFKIETFGFVSGGVMDLTLSDLKLHAPSFAYYNSTGSKKSKNSKPDEVTYSMGFLMRRANSESDAQQDLETIIEKGECILDKKRDVDFFFDLSDPSKWHKTTVQHVVDADSAGLYSLIFTRCTPSSLYFTSFKLDVKFTNPGPNYLSAGDVPLPTVYLFFFLLHVCALVAWILVLNRDQTQFGKVHRIHYMMLVLLVFKILSVLFESIRYHYIAIFGVSEMWSILYYIFTFLKGIMLFTVIMLIGSGYSLMKSYLNDNEKKIIMVVLALQVLDNIAMVVLEETAPGTQGWLTWRDILHIVDILCCLAILLPIVWSMKHLRQAAEVDGKAHHSLVKLQLFRQFYIMVIIYIYFTRIAVYLLAATIPYYLLWLGPFATESATFVFFVVTGYKFRPAIDNPYLPVRTEDSEGDEYGLKDEENTVGIVVSSSANTGANAGLELTKLNK